MQPDSIRRFSQLYLASVAAALLAAIIGFPGYLAAVEAQVGAGDPSVVRISAIIGLAFSIGISLLLWHLTANKGFVIAKWVVVLFFLFNLISVYTVFAGGLETNEIASLASLLLQAAAVYCLFRPDSSAWFASETEPDTTPED